MVEVSWTNQSIEDIKNIAEFIAKDSPRYADSQVELFFTQAEILGQFPTLGRIVPETSIKTVRELVIGNYRLVYEIINPKQIDILTIHHSARLLKNSPAIKKKLAFKK
ncbi:MAG: type II toxin-antitoxin system RelE/ParE family toxin [Bacteroidia bacterium]